MIFLASTFSIRSRSFNNYLPAKIRWSKIRSCHSSVTTMQQIGEWLKKLGMSEYTEPFAEERIEIDVLPELTDQDLERLRIPLGHRRRMLRAIRELSGPASATRQATPAASPPAQGHAERRQLTVMFCDLVRLDRAVCQARP
jgi:hypothetical protein